MNDSSRSSCIGVFPDSVGSHTPELKSAINSTAIVTPWPISGPITPGSCSRASALRALSTRNWRIAVRSRRNGPAWMTATRSSAPTAAAGGLSGDVRKR